MTHRFAPVLLLALSTSGVNAAVTVDLSQIGHLASRGRVQDEQFNPHNQVVGALLAAGSDTVPFLVAKLVDEAEVKGPVLDFWPHVHVGDVALMVLCDLFTAPDRSHTTIPGLAWDSLLDRGDLDTPAWALLERYVAAHGRQGLQSKVEQVLAPYRGRYAWDTSDRCFRPLSGTPPRHRAQPSAGVAPGRAGLPRGGAASWAEACPTCGMVTHQPGLLVGAGALQPGVRGRVSNPHHLRPTWW